MTAFQRGNSRASKLSVSEVLAIREAYSQSRVSQGALSRKYQVSVITIGRIVRGETWQGLATPEKEMSEGELKGGAERLLAMQEGMGRLAEEVAEHGKGDRMLEELVDEDKLADVMSPLLEKDEVMLAAAEELMTKSPLDEE